MKTKAKYAFLIATDIISVLLSVGLCVVVATQMDVVIYRGFHCNDLHIRYPKVTLPIKLVHELAIFFFTPLIILVGIETIILMRNHSKNFFTSIVHLACVFTFCMFIALFLCLVLKNLFGILRPNFHEACKPDFECKFENRLEYVKNFTCTSDYGKKVWQYSRQSFPSYFATIGAQSSFTLVFYLESRFDWERKLILKSLAQLPCIFLGIGLPMINVFYRINHMEDIFLGYFIGTFFAYLMAFRMTDWFNKKPSSSPQMQSEVNSPEAPSEEYVEDPSANKIE